MTGPSNSLSTDNIEEIIYLSPNHHYKTYTSIPEELVEKVLFGRIQEIRESEIIAWMESLPLMQMHGHYFSPLISSFFDPPDQEMQEALTYKSQEEKQRMVGILCYRLHSLREASVLKYPLSESKLIGKEYIALIESVKGEELGEDLARRYGFSKFLDEKLAPMGKWIDVDAKWMVLTSRRKGDALIFFATSDTIPQQTYFIGVLWSPLWLAKKYQEEELPTILL